MYTVERANLISNQIRKFTDSNTWMVAGQFANIEFWMDEVIVALNALDGHRSRFDSMYNAQKEWIDNHGTKVPDYCYICGGVCELSNGPITPPLPKRKYKAEKAEARKELIDSAYFFLTRCFKVGLLNEEQLEKRCDSIGTSIDPMDIEKNRTTRHDREQPHKPATRQSRRNGLVRAALHMLDTLCVIANTR